MNTTESFFVEALRAFAFEDGKKLNTEGVDREKLYSLAKRHSVTGILSYVVTCHGLFEGESIVEKLRNQYEKTLSVMLRRSMAAEALSRRFSENAIPHIPFKGSEIAKYYPIPELRVYSDADMIVKEESLDKIDAFMKKKGFERSIADMGVVTCYKNGVEFYELHTALNIPDDEARVFSDVWGNAEPAGGSAYRFNKSFHLAYLISHLEKHMRSGGAGIKMYLDIALYMKNATDIDFSLVKKLVEDCSLYPFFETVLWLCHKWFGLELPFEIRPMDEKTYEKLCSFTLSEGVYGDHSQEGGLESSLARMSKDGKKCAKLRFVLSRVFPHKEELYRIYPRFEGKPLMLPIAWCMRMFSFADKNKRKNISAVMNTSVKSAQNRQAFLADIGCKN